MLCDGVEFLNGREVPVVDIPFMVTKASVRCRKIRRIECLTKNLTGVFLFVLCVQRITIDERFVHVEFRL